MKQFSIRIISAFAAAVMCLSSVAALSTASPFSAVLNAADTSSQSESFLQAVEPMLLFATSRSLCGRNGKWMAFVDITQSFENGSPSGFALQQATVQYGMQSLPEGTGDCELSIGSVTQSQSGKMAGSTFSFSPAGLSKTALSDAVSVGLKSRGEDILIELSEEYPAIDLPSHQQAIKLMAPAYVEFSGTVEPVDVKGAFMKLRGYAKNIDTMDRNFIWELYLMHGESLPCKATIIRYDITSKRISINQRIIREY